MPHVHDDFLDQLEREIVLERRMVARHVDRAEALVALHARALDVASGVNRAISVDDVFQSARNEIERAELQALADRITGGAEPASGDGNGPGPHEDTGAGF